MFCKNCGKEIPDNAKFCRYCSAPTGNQPAGPSAPAPQVQPPYAPEEPGSQPASYAPPAAPEGKKNKGSFYIVAAVIFIVLAAAIVLLSMNLTKDGKKEDVKKTTAEITAEETASKTTTTSTPVKETETAAPENAERGNYDTEKAPDLKFFTEFTDIAGSDAFIDGAEDIYDFDSLKGYWQVFIAPDVGSGKLCSLKISGTAENTELSLKLFSTVNTSGEVTEVQDKEITDMKGHFDEDIPGIITDDKSLDLGFFGIYKGTMFSAGKMISDGKTYTVVALR